MKVIFDWVKSLEMFKTKDGANFRTDLKWLAHKIWMLKGRFPLGEIFRAQRNFSLSFFD